jgi:hypothetical protein
MSSCCLTKSILPSIADLNQIASEKIRLSIAVISVSGVETAYLHEMIQQLTKPRNADAVNNQYSLNYHPETSRKLEL